MYLFKATSSPGCVFCCLHSVVDYGNKHPPLLLEIVKHNFYVDDCLKSLQSAEKSIEVIRDFAQLLQKSGFPSRSKPTALKFSTWFPNKKEKEIQTYDIANTQFQKVLGVQWNFKEGAFLFSVSLSDKSLIRRGLLLAIFSLFDPFGSCISCYLDAKTPFAKVMQKDTRMGSRFGRRRREVLENMVPDFTDIEKLADSVVF